MQPASFPEIVSFFSRSWLFTSCLNAFLCYSSCFTSVIVVLFSMFFSFSLCVHLSIQLLLAFCVIVLANYLSMILCYDIIFRLGKAIAKLFSPPEMIFIVFSLSCFQTFQQFCKFIIIQCAIAYVLDHNFHSLLFGSSNVVLSFSLFRRRLPFLLSRHLLCRRLIRQRLQLEVL